MPSKRAESMMLYSKATLTINALSHDGQLWDGWSGRWVVPVREMEEVSSQMQKKGDRTR